MQLTDESRVSPSSDPPISGLPIDIPSIHAESLTTLLHLMRTAERETTRLSAARSLATLTTRLLRVGRIGVPRLSEAGSLHPPEVPLPSEAASLHPPCAPTQTTTPPPHLQPALTSNPPAQPPSTSSRRTPKRTPARNSSTSTLNTNTASTISLASSPPAPLAFVSATPPLKVKHYPFPHPVLDPLWDVLTSPIPTSPMTQAEQDELHSLNTNLDHHHIADPRWAARWRHRLRECRFYKAYWEERDKNPDLFRRVYEDLCNRNNPTYIRQAPEYDLRDPPEESSTISSSSTMKPPIEPSPLAAAEVRDKQLDRLGAGTPAASAEGRPCITNTTWHGHQ